MKFLATAANHDIEISRSSLRSRRSHNQMSCAISSASEGTSPAQRQQFKIREYDV